MFYLVRSSILLCAIFTITHLFVVNQRREDLLVHVLFKNGCGRCLWLFPFQLLSTAGKTKMTSVQQPFPQLPLRPLQYSGLGFNLVTTFN